MNEPTTHREKNTFCNYTENSQPINKHYVTKQKDHFKYNISIYEKYFDKENLGVPIHTNIMYMNVYLDIPSVEYNTQYYMYTKKYW